MGGLYGVHRLRSQGLTVLGIESAPDVGGVWYHNAYPGARVDLESHYYCYFFDGDLYRDWKWTERYAAQPEILAYLNHVADRFDIRRHFSFNTSVVGATWDPDAAQWVVETSAGDTVRCSFLVMATGQLSKPKDPPFPGLEEFEGSGIRRRIGPASRLISMVAGSGS